MSQENIIASSSDSVPVVLLQETEKGSNETEAAAIKIQSRVRGAQGRRTFQEKQITEQMLRAAESTSNDM